jgi:formylglycine-generating enzyme required for sulfatase activity
MTPFMPGPKRSIRSCAIVAAAVTLPFLLGCGPDAGSNGDDDDGAGGTNPSGGTAGATGGRSGSTGSGGSGANSGFECTSSASPGELVEVDSGDFVMGCDDDDCDDDERPMHTVALDAFEIERTEVTQDQYAACVSDGACDSPSCAWDCDQTELPATCLTFEQAKTYCEWAGRRLPTEAEWEKAARGEDGGKYPWGSDEPDCGLVNMAGCGDETMPVGSLPDGASPYGALDMAGNVVEMVADWYDPEYYAESPSENPTGPATGVRYVGRGGGCRSEADWQRTSKRDWYDLVDQGPSLGFRCAR